jgi:hypothetical protein
MSKQRLYIDESGDHTIQGVKASQWDKRYMGLFGCSFEFDYCRSVFNPAIEALKKKHFGDEMDEPIILHREEIKKRVGPFKVLLDKSKSDAFCADLLGLVNESNFRAFIVLIDKLGCSGRYYGLPESQPYHIGLLTMLERYCGWLSFSRQTGDVLAEARGEREDKQLKAAYREIYAGGTRFKPSAFFQRTLSTKEIKIKLKAANISGLQFADLLAYPAKMRMLEDRGITKPTSGFTKEIADALEKKYNRRFANSQVSGYGKVYIA